MICRYLIGQVRARARGIDEEETKSDAAKAIQSIPAYVEVSTIFLALVPAVKDPDKDYIRDYTSWLARGARATPATVLVLNRVKCEQCNNNE